MSKYRTAPLEMNTMPPGIAFIVGNEAAERFSYYGMRAILLVYMSRYLLNYEGQPDPLDENTAKTYYHAFLSAVYFFPLLGAIVSDGLLGKYRTIVSLSIVYCLGHLALAIDETRIGLLAGLALIALGSGGIKPCVSAHVGDQFGAGNQHLLARVYGWFYFAVNFGSLFSTLLTPWLLEQYGSRVAFAVPGVLMLLATLVFWLGRYRYAHVPPAGNSALAAAVRPDGLRALGRLAMVYVFVAVFWSLFDQTSSAWILQAERMDRTLSLGPFGERTVLPAQVHALNPFLILLFIPLFAYVIYPALGRAFRLTPLRKIGLGLFVTALSFAISALIEHWLDAGQRVHIAWQGLAYVVITAGEVLVSITCLEFSYTQAPRELKSIVMAANSFSVSLGNGLTALVNYIIQHTSAGSRLVGADYYWFFTWLMLFTAVTFILMAMRFREHAYLQNENP